MMVVVMEFYYEVRDGTKSLRCSHYDGNVELQSGWGEKQL
jgi:hypothetical protein